MEVARAGAEERDEMQRAQELVNQLQVMKDEATAIAQKISELDQERHEHSLVAETLEKLDSDRKCFRLKIYGTTNRNTLRERIEDMVLRMLESKMIVLMDEFFSFTSHSLTLSLTSLSSPSLAPLVYTE